MHWAVLLLTKNNYNTHSKMWSMLTAYHSALSSLYHHSTYSGCDGISFAIPMDFAVQVIRQLIANKKVIRPSIGLAVGNFNRATGGKLVKRHEMQGIFDSNDIVVVVTAVSFGSPAYEAGVRE